MYPNGTHGKSFQFFYCTRGHLSLQLVEPCCQTHCTMSVLLPLFFNMLQFTLLPNPVIPNYIILLCRGGQDPGPFVLCHRNTGPWLIKRFGLRPLYFKGGRPSHNANRHSDIAFSCRICQVSAWQPCSPSDIIPSKIGILSAYTPRYIVKSNKTVPLLCDNRHDSTVFPRYEPHPRYKHKTVGTQQWNP